MKCVEVTTMKLIHKSWHNLNSIVIHSQGYSHGLVFAWNQNTIQMDHIWETRNTLTMKFSYVSSSMVGYITIVYGPHPTQEELKFIEEIQFL
jgi:hypothetical protein